MAALIGGGGGACLDGQHFGVEAVHEGGPGGPQLRVELSGGGRQVDEERALDAAEALLPVPQGLAPLDVVDAVILHDHQVPAAIE